MATIGTLTFTTFGIAMLRAVVDSRLVKRAGVNGQGVVFHSWTAPVAEGPTAAIVSSASYIQQESVYRAMVGQTVTVRDQFDRTWSNVLVIACNLRHPAKLVTGDYLLVADWALLPESTPPAGAQV